MVLHDTPPLRRRGWEKKTEPMVLQRGGVVTTHAGCASGAQHCVWHTGVRAEPLGSARHEDRLHERLVRRVEEALGRDTVIARHAAKARRRQRRAAAVHAAN